MLLRVVTSPLRPVKTSLEEGDPGPLINVFTGGISSMVPTAADSRESDRFIDGLKTQITTSEGLLTLGYNAALFKLVPKFGLAMDRPSIPLICKPSIPGIEFQKPVINLPFIVQEFKSMGGSIGPREVALLERLSLKHPSAPGILAMRAFQLELPLGDTRSIPVGGGRLFEQYSLRASDSGFYPIMKWGSKDPVGITWLEKGDPWKFGTTGDPVGRYTIDFLTRTGDHGLLYLTEFLGSEAEVFMLEKMKILNYKHQTGRLPPGNKVIK
jgi:hypothetical protein